MEVGDGLITNQGPVLGAAAQHVSGEASVCHVEKAFRYRQGSEDYESKS